MVDALLLFLLETLKFLGIVVLEVLHDYVWAVLKFLENVLALPDCQGQTLIAASKEEIVSWVIVVWPWSARILVFIKNYVHDPRQACLETFIVKLAVRRSGLF